MEITRLDYDQWSLFKSVNPITGRIIKPSGSVYKAFEKFGRQRVENQEELYLQENQSDIIEQLNENSDMYNFFYVNDCVGSGKTITYLSWILHRKTNNLFYKTIVVVSKNLLKQWKSDLEKYFNNERSLSVFCIFNIEPYSHTDLKSVDIVLCTDTEFLYTIIENFFPQPIICFDEINSFKFKRNGWNGFRSSILRMTKVVILSADPFSQFYQTKEIVTLKVLESFQSIKEISPSKKTKFDHKIWITTQYYSLSKNVSFLRKYVSAEFYDKLVENNIESLLNSIKSTLNTEDIKIGVNDKNLIFWVRMYKIYEIKKLREDEEKNNVDHTKKIDKLKKDIKELKNKLESQTECAICNIDIKSVDDLVLMSCCQNSLCKICHSEISKRNIHCPFCRGTSGGLTVDEFKISDSQCTLTNRLLNIINLTGPSGSAAVTKQKRILIFSATLSKKNNDYGIPNCLFLSGTVKQRNLIIDNYKTITSETKILFLDIKDNYYGLRLENTTHIVFLNFVQPHVKQQIIGRAIRLGREPGLNLYVYNLLVKN